MKFMLCYVMLCYVMLCYVMLCYVMLCYVMLCYADYRTEQIDGESIIRLLYGHAQEYAYM